MVTQRPGSWTRTMTFNRSWSVSPFSGQFQGKDVMILVERFSLRRGLDWKRRQLPSGWSGSISQEKALHFCSPEVSFLWRGLTACFLCLCVCHSIVSLCHPMDCSHPGFSVHGIFPGKSTGVGCYFLFQGIFLTQGSNPGLFHCRQILYHLSHQACFLPATYCFPLAICSLHSFIFAWNVVLIYAVKTSRICWFRFWLFFSKCLLLQSPLHPSGGGDRKFRSKLGLSSLTILL